ncbi:MAG: UDP-glucose/GDP-mannose dehydrogenase family protein [Actinomycetes bacterium]
MSPRLSIENPRITVIGTGYLGAVHAACMADFGFDVLGVDVDAGKIEKLAAGEPPFYEPGFAELLRSALDTGRLRFGTDFAEAGEFGDVHFLCVGTPQRQGSNAADISYVDEATSALAVHLNRPCLVVGKSTVPVGTAARLADLLVELAPAGSDVELAWNPEFLREGFAVADTVRPDRLVVGVTSEGADQLLRTVYRKQLDDGVPYLTTDLATAELVKVAANSFLATKISFINAMAEICEATGADVAKLAEAIGYDERIGSKFLRAGLGFGGGCLPKDIRAFMARAGELGLGDSLRFLYEVDEINQRRRSKAVQIATEMVGGSVTGLRVAALGAAFKPDSDDVRDSPALNVAASLQLHGAHVRVYDPKAMANSAKYFPTLHYVSDAAEACTDADIVLLLTEWSEFVELDPVELAKLTSARRILDCRNVLDPQQWRDAGWQIHSLGRP